MGFDRRKFLKGGVFLSGALGIGVAELATSKARGQSANPQFSDPLFNQPYVDMDEWRDSPVRHRYVHGGFRGTEARFSCYFPPREIYHGRFFQYITAVPISENASQGLTGEDNNIGFAIASGGYFVESNQGGSGASGSPGGTIDPTIAGYRVSAASAQYSRILARQMYGPHRTYGYVFGGSGGSYRTVSGFENTDVWDGAVPYIMPTPMAIPNVYSVRLNALRLVGDKLRDVVDAVDPGGSDDIYEGLSDDQRQALSEATRLGFPPRSWFNYETLGLGAFAVLNDLVVKNDPSYFDDFWRLPGYLGADPPASLTRARIQHRTAVTRVIMSNEAVALGIPGPETMRNPGDAAVAWQNFQNQYPEPFPVAFQVQTPPPAGSLIGASIMIKSGAGAGGRLSVGHVMHDMVTIQFTPVSGSLREISGNVRAGDEVQIDNSNFLAVQTYHRHQVPTRDYHVFDQFRGFDAKPIYPQRPRLLGPLFAVGAGGTLQSGRFKGKMILVENLMDADAFPWQADWYRTKVGEHLGARLNDNFRLWFTDHTLHGGPPQQSDNTRVIGYRGVLHQALRDLSAWVERDTPPPPSTSYRIDDGQVVVPPTAAQRKGVQPVVTLTANGGARADARVGQTVEFVGVIEAPPNTGKIITAEWDFDGSGAFTEKSAVDPAPRVRVMKTHAFAGPGTYFVVLRGISQRQGDAGTDFARIRNLGRTRVVVTG